MNRQSIIDEVRNSKTLRRWEIRDLNLSELDLSGVDCTGTRFSGCTLRGVHLNGACLNEASFHECHFTGLALSGATAQGAQFINCRGLDKETKKVLTGLGATIVDPKNNPLNYLFFAFIAAVILVVIYFIFISVQRSKNEPLKVPGDAMTDVDPKVVFKEGSEKLAAKEYSSALPLLQTAAERMPENLEVRYTLARCLLETGKYQEARAQLETVLSKNPPQEIDVPAHQFLAEAYQKDGKSEFADKVYLAMIEKYSDLPEVVYGLYLNHANLRWKTKDFAGALKLMDDLLRIGKPEQHAGVFLLKGLIYKDMGKPDQAKQEFERIIREFKSNSPTVLDAKVQLVMEDIEQGRHEKAETSLKNLMKEGADVGQIFNALMNIYRRRMEAGEKAEAMNLLESMEKMFSSHPENLATIHVEFGKLAMENKELENARAHFEKVLALTHDPVQSAWASESIEEIKRSTTPPLK